MHGSILIADDHEVVRSGLTILLRRMLPQVNIIQAESVEEAIEFLKQHQVDLLLCDINMPGGNNVEMLHRMRAIQPDLKILILTAFKLPSYKKKYLQEGANGYISKMATNNEIQQAITAVLHSGYYHANEPEKTDGTTEPVGPDHSIAALLSYREMEISRLLVKGLGILEIANTLNLQSNTISTYKKRIFTKLQVNSIPELISILNDYADWQVD